VVFLHTPPSQKNLISATDTFIALWIHDRESNF